MFSDFFESLFGQGGFDFGTGPGAAGARAGRGRRGEDQTHRIELSVEEAYRGVQRTLQLQLVEPMGPGHGTTRSRTLNVRIPAGVTEGQKIRLSGQGGPGIGGGAAGNLLLEVHIRPHALYTLDGSDIVVALPAAPWEAALGGRVEVPTPGGQVAITIAPGSQSGKRHRLRGRGMPGKTPGDLYAVLNIVNPPVDTEEAKALFEQMARTIPFNPRAHLK
jgi:curved DNA-binding protein